MTFGPSERVTIDGAPRATQPCATPMPIGALLPIATATTPCDRARPSANRARTAPPAAPPASGTPPPRAPAPPRADRAWVPRFRTEKQQPDAIGTIADPGQGFGCGTAPGGRGVPRLNRADPGRERRRESDRRAPRLHQSVL